jgi:hypothetical protein
VLHNDTQRGHTVTPAQTHNNMHHTAARTTQGDNVVSAPHGTELIHWSAAQLHVRTPGGPVKLEDNTEKHTQGRQHHRPRLEGGSKISTTPIGSVYRYSLSCWWHVAAETHGLPNQTTTAGATPTESSPRAHTLTRTHAHTHLRVHPRGGHTQTINLASLCAYEQEGLWEGRHRGVGWVRREGQVTPLGSTQPTAVCHCNRTPGTWRNGCQTALSSPPPPTIFTNDVPGSAPLDKRRFTKSLQLLLPGILDAQASTCVCAHHGPLTGTGGVCMGSVW